MKISCLLIIYSQRNPILIISFNFLAIFVFLKVQRFEMEFCVCRKAMAEKQEEKASLPLHLSNTVSPTAASPLPSSLGSDSGSSPGVDKSAAERERQRQREQERRKREAVSIIFLLLIFRVKCQPLAPTLIIFTFFDDSQYLISSPVSSGARF